VDSRWIQGNTPIVEKHKVAEHATVLYIRGRGRSVTTILAQTLDHISGFVNVGEYWHSLWYRGLRDDERCGCGQPLTRASSGEPSERRRSGGGTTST
jgi:hypothetical protein